MDPNKRTNVFKGKTLAWQLDDGGQGSRTMGNFRGHKTRHKSKNNRFEENHFRKSKKFYLVQEDTTKIKDLFSRCYTKYN